MEVWLFLLSDKVWLFLSSDGSVIISLEMEVRFFLFLLMEVWLFLWNEWGLVISRSLVMDVW